MIDERLAIRSLLATSPPTVLSAGEAHAPAFIGKAGIVPFIPDATTENWRFYVMRPIPKKPELGAPPLQLGKGTRMVQIGSKWKDIRKDQLPEDATDIEPLAETALREGIEELGLHLDNITRLWDLGPHSFRSASKGEVKWMWLFAARVHDPAHFLPDSAIAKSTAERRWISLGEARGMLRADHVPMLIQTKTLLEVAVK